MKRLLLIFSTLLFLLPSVWAVDCMIESTEHRIGTNTSFTYGPMTFGTTKMSIDIKRSWGGAGTVYIETSPNNSSYTQRLALQSGEMGTEYQTYQFSSSTSDRYVRMRVSGGTLYKWYANLKSVEIFDLSTTSLDFGNVVTGSSSQKTFTISWQQVSGGISVNNGRYTLSASSFGSTNCGANGSATVTVTFSPTSIGTQSGTITVGSKTISVTGVGTIAPPTGLTVTGYTNTAASFSWNAVTGATGYRIKNRTTGATKDVSGTSGTVTGLSADTYYEFSVMALNGSTPSSESNVVNFTTYFYDPTRCVAKQYAQEHGYNKNTTDPYWGHSITASPFTVKASFELKKASGITGSKYSWNDYHTSTQWYAEQNKISKDNVYESGYTKFGEYTFKEYTDSIQFVTNAANNFYVKNFVAYYDYGIAGDNVDFGNVIAGSTTTKYITVRYANTMGQSLSASLSGDTGFSLGTVPSKGSCEVGTITIPVTYVANYGAGTKTAKVTLSNGQTATVTITATVALAPPAGLKVTGTTNNTVSLSWNKVTSASGYRIKNVTLGTTQDVSGENTTSYTWGGLNADTDYTFTVMSLMNTTPSTESGAVTGHTLYYDPSRCIAINDATEYEYNNDDEKYYYIPSSPFPVKVSFELEKSGGMASGRSTWINYHTGKDDKWYEKAVSISQSDVSESSYKKFGEYTFNANTDIIQFLTDANNNFYVRRMVVYYEPGLEADALDFGTVDANSVTTKYVTVRYANTMGQSLTASLSGTGFTIGSFDAKGSCAVGTIQIPVTYTAHHGFGEKYATITLGNGKSASATIKVTVAQPAPTNFRVSGLTNNSVTLSWDKVSDVDGYRINNTTLGTYQDISATNATYTWGGLNADTDYKFTVMSLKNNIPSTPSAQVTGHTLFYDPSRCVVMADATELSFTSGSEKDYYFFNIPGFVVSQLPLEARFELMRADGVTDSRTIQINSWNNDGSWENKVWSTTGGNLSINNFWQFDGEIPANSKAIQFETNATKNIYLKNVVVYYKTGIKADNVDFGKVSASSAPVHKTLTIHYANETPLTITSFSGEGFSIGSLAETVGCGVGTTTLDVTFTPQTQWEGLVKSGSIKFSNGATLDVNLTATVILNKVQNFALAGKTSSSVSLSWTTQQYAEKYEITANGETRTVTGTSYTWSGLNSATNYDFSIVAVRGTQKSEASVVSVRTMDVAPANFAASNIEQTTMTLSWDAVPTVTSAYKLVNTTTGASQRVSGTSVDLTGLTAETWYDFDLYSMYGDEEQEKTSLHVRTELAGSAEVDGVGYPTIAEALEVADGKTIRILCNTSENITVTNKAFINGANKTIGNVTIASTGSLEIVTKTLNAGTFIIRSDSKGDHYQSGQYYSALAEGLHLSGDSYAEIALDPSGVGDDNRWYCFTVPFPVDAQQGVYKVNKDGSATKGVWFSTYAIIVYDGAARAAMDNNEWKYYEGTLNPGTLYQIGTDGTNVWRFKKDADAPLVTEETSLPLNEYPSESAYDAGWNTLGSNALYHVKASVASEAQASTFVQLYKNGDGHGAYCKYTTMPLSEVDLNVAAAFFLQYSPDMGSTLSFERQTSTKSAAVFATSIYDVRIGKSGSEEYEDRLFVSAAEDALNEYQLGYDVLKMGDLGMSTTAAMWIRSYKKNLSVCRAPLTAKSADFLMRLYAPQAGNYDLYIGKDVPGNTTLYLTKDGEIVADLSEAYSVTLAQGVTTQYGLRIVVDDSEDKAAEVDGQKYDKVQEAIDDAEGSEIVILKDVTEDITISNKVVMKGDGHSVGNVLVTKSGSLELENSLTAADFIIKSDSKGECFESGEYHSADADALTLTGDAYIDITLDPSGTGDGNKWYSFTVPFPVDSREGVYKLNAGVATKGVWGSTYMILEYDGAKRATGAKGWVYTSGTLVPGRFYQIGTDGTNTFRFKKTSDGALVTAETSVALNEYASSQVTDAGWNAIGNNSLYHVSASVAPEAMFTTFVQVYENGNGTGSNGKYATKLMSEVDFNVAAPFFVQYAPMMGSSVNFERTSATKSAADYSSSLFDVRIAANGSTGYDDRLFVSAAADAKDEYEIGYDVAKMGDVDKGSNALLWVKAYNTNLSVCRAPLTGVEAEFDMSIYAPADGIYNLYLGAEADGNATLYLTKNGTKVADLSDGYSLTLQKGVNTKYGLLIEVDDIETSASDAESGNIVVTANNGIITISNVGVGDDYSIFDVSGRTIASGVASATEVKEAVANDASSRILIVKVKDKIVKVVY